MRRHAKELSAGSNYGTGRFRGHFRRSLAARGASGDSKGSGAPSRLTFPIVVAVAVIAVLLVAFAGTAAAAEPVFTVDPATVGYTSAEVKATINPEGNQVAYQLQYTQDPVAEGWKPVHEGLFNVPKDSSPHAVSDTVTGLKPDTEYKVRLLVVNFENFAEIYSEEPYVTFTTKHIDAPAVTQAAVTAITTTTAHFSGTVNADAPAGALDPEQEASYETSWRFECDPECAGAPSGVIKPGEAAYRAAEAGRPVAFDATRLETNTTYQVRLIATSGGGAKETIAERAFPTLLVAPTVKSAPGAPDGQGGYVVEGIVNPLGSSITDCHFEYGPTASYVFQAPCSPEPLGRNEEQELSYNNANEGQFRLVFEGQETGDIDYGATSATVKAALQALSTIGPDGIASVTASEIPGQPTPGPYTVTFGGPLGETNIPGIVGKSGTDPLRRSVSDGGGFGSLITTTKSQGGNSLPSVVEAHLTGLTPGATYHVQLVATNAGGKGLSGDRTFVPTLDPPQPPCPNEAVRRENNSLTLPECRAYEMVTSPFKGGYKASFIGFYGGEAVLYGSQAGNIASSGQGQGVSNDYVANRTGNGWETIPSLNPAGTLNAGPEALSVGSPLLYSEDLQTSYWFAAPGRAYPSIESAPYLKGPDGRFTAIGIPTGGGMEERGVIGASADLSHVVLEGETPSASQRPAYGPGLYEFIGTGNGAPHRVDLDKSDQPISECPVVGLEPPAALGKAVSRDGRTVFFVALGGCGAAGPPADEVWARVDGTTSYDASESQCTRVDCDAPAPAQFVAAATDGSSVFFTTTQQLVNGDTDETNDLYVYRLPTASDPSPSPTLIEVSGTATGADVEEGPVVSADGSTAMFVSPAVLVGNEDAREETATQGDHNLYVWRRDSAHPGGQVKFVGRLIDNDVTPLNPHGFGLFFSPEMTPDGRYLALSTTSPLAPTDTDNAADIYRYDTESGALVRVSTGPLGTGGNADGFAATLASRNKVYDLGVVGVQGTWQTHPSITDDGQAIVFTTAQGLVPKDGNGTNDIYLWKAGRVSLISSGAAGNQVSGTEGDFAIDPSGQDIYFVTGDQLSPSDGDAVRDVYDARVEGGFSFAEPPICSGEACQPAGTGSLSSPSAATNQARGSESPTKSPPKKSCPKGKVLKKGKCVKQQHKKRGKHHKKHKGKRGATKRGGGK